MGLTTEAMTNITLKQFTPPPATTCIKPCPLPPTSSICGGPISGCGLLTDFGDDCLLSNYNCLHSDAGMFKMLLGFL